MEKGKTRPQFITTANTVTKWMTTQPTTISLDMTLGDVIHLFSENNFYGIPVINSAGYIEGMVTKTTIMLAMYKNKSVTEPIKNIMETSFDAVYPMDPLEKAVNMREGCLPVIAQDGKLVGIITRTDLLKAKSIGVETTPDPLFSVSVMQQVLDSAYEAVVMVDTDGRITEINEAYCKIINQRREDVINRPVEEVIDNTRLHHTCRTGEGEDNQIQRINGQEMIVHRVPLKRNQQLVGAMGLVIYRNVDEMFALTNKITHSYFTDLEGEQTKETYYLSKIIGNSPVMVELKNMIKKVSPLPSNVLITGESGSGKELCARTIHQLSQFVDGKFIAINCSAIPENLLESELFGYAEGAFTGALKNGKKGKFELAEGGTIFLDEIGDMPLAMQAKLLRVLQEKTIEPVGATYSKRINSRVIAATNQKLEEQVEKGEFREDLYYRLNVLPITLPSLKESPSDIPTLLDHYLTFFARKFQKPVPQLEDDAKNLLWHYPFPGNIRELANLCEALVGLNEDGRIKFADIPERIRKKRSYRTTCEDEGSLKSSLEQVAADAERVMIQNMLKECNGNKSLCAQKLGIQRSTLYNKLKNYRIV